MDDRTEHGRDAAGQRLSEDGSHTISAAPVGADPLDEPLEYSTEAYLATDRDGIVVDVNETAGSLLGSAGADLRGSRLADRLDDSLLVEHVDTARTQETETRFHGHDETLDLWIAGRVYPGEDGVAVFFRDVTRAHRLQTELSASADALERLHDIATDQSMDIEAKIVAMLEVGVDRLDTSTGLLARTTEDTWEVTSVAGDPLDLEPGTTRPLSATYCRHTLDSDDPVGFVQASDSQWREDTAAAESDLECYLGASVRVADEQYGTVCFVDPDPREQSFTDREYTFAEVLTNWIHYLLEQQAYERELESEKAFTESLLDSLPSPLYAFDERGSLLRWNDRFETVIDGDPTTAESFTPTDMVDESDRQQVQEAFDTVRSGEQTSLEVGLATGEGPTPYELSGAPLRDGTDDVVGVVGTARDISDHRAHQQRLSGLLDTTQSLMQARDREHVAQVTVTAARDLLGFDTCVFHLYNGEGGILEPAAATGAAADVDRERLVFDVGSGAPGEVFASGEAIHERDIDPDSAAIGAVRSVLHYPVGVRGTISVGASDPDAFDETDEQLLALLATSAAGACTRAKREQDVREARAHTERVLERVNGLVDETVEVLVAATTREEVESGVVEKLSDAEPYAFAWVSRPDIASETLQPTAWAGDAGTTVDGTAVDLREDAPHTRAFTEESVQVVDQPTVDSGPFLEDPAAVDSLISIPLGYKETTYGVLNVATATEAIFDDREQVVLEALGRAVANAINAVERGRILDATEIVELEFTVGDSELLFNRLSAATGGRLEAVATEYRSDGNIQLYVSATAVDATRIAEFADEAADIVETTPIVDTGEECLVEVVVSRTLLATLAEHGALPQAVVTENGTTRFTVELPYQAEARTLYELVEEQYPQTELVGYRERERPVETRQNFTSEIRDRLTGRQKNALQIAYHGGFFDWPREVDGNELAEAMDISRPTYHQHLRAAQAKVFTELFE